MLIPPHAIYKWENGREYLLVRMQFLSRPSGLTPRVSSVTEPLWFPVAALPEKFSRPATKV